MGVAASDAFVADLALHVAGGREIVTFRGPRRSALASSHGGLLCTGSPSGEASTDSTGTAAKPGQGSDVGRMDIDRLTSLRVFTVAQARATGLSRRQFEAAVKAEAIVKRRRTVFATPAAVAEAGRSPASAHAFDIEALMLALSRKRIAAAGPSAGVIHGLEFAEPPLQRLVVCTADAGVSSTRRDGYALRTAPLPDGHVVRRHHVPVTSIARTLLELAGELPFAHAVATVDAARHQHQVTWAQLEAVMEWGAGRPDIQAARKAILFSDPRSESVLESISRAVMQEQGVPIPNLQVEIFTAGGMFVARADFVWDLPVIGEPDGLGKYVLPGTDLVRLRVIRNEKARQQGLIDQDYEVVRWDWAVANDPPRLADRLLAALKRAEARVHYARTKAG